MSVSTKEEAPFESNMENSVMRQFEDEDLNESVKYFRLCLKNFFVAISELKEPYLRFIVSEL